MAILTPSITVTPESGFISIDYTNPGAATFNFLRRDGQYIGKTIPDSIPDPDVAFFNDYQARSGQQVSYVGSAFDGTQESAPTPPLTGTVTLSSVWIHHVAKTTNGNIGELGAIELFNLEGQQTTQSRDTNVLRLAAQEKPKIRTASASKKEIHCPILIKGSEWPAMKNAFEAILWSNELFCFRDPLGEMIFCTIPTQEMKIDINVTMTLVLWQSSYSEVI